MQNNFFISFLLSKFNLTLRLTALAVMFTESKFIKNKIDLFHIILPLTSRTNFVLYIIIPILFAKFFKSWKKFLKKFNFLCPSLI